LREPIFEFSLHGTEAPERLAYFGVLALKLINVDLKLTKRFQKSIFTIFFTTLEVFFGKFPKILRDIIQLLPCSITRDFLELD